jgi:malonyl-CoA O-methyltransferase
MSDFHFDHRQVQRSFSRAARTYEQHDVLQQEVQQGLIERLEFNLTEPSCIVDVGAGTGRGTALLKKRHPKAQVIAIDLAVPMLQEARHHSGWLRPFARVCGDAQALPLPDASVDLLHSNLCYQWCEDLPRLFNECVRVLRPGGFFAFTTFGPDTLRELRSAWASTDEDAHVARFLDMHDLGDAMLGAGLKDPVLSVERYTLTYAEPQGLLRDLKGLGATNADTTRQRGLTGKTRYRRMLEAYEALRADGRIPATWEVVTAHAWGAPAGQSRRSGDGEIASFPIDSLRGSRRRK